MTLPVAKLIQPLGFGNFWRIRLRSGSWYCLFGDFEDRFSTQVSSCRGREITSVINSRLGKVPLCPRERRELLSGLFESFASSEVNICLVFFFGCCLFFFYWRGFFSVAETIRVSVYGKSVEIVTRWLINS